MKITYKESKVRTNKLKCGSCGNKIRIGENAIFELVEYSYRPMIDVHHFDCAPELQGKIEYDYAEHCQD